MNRGVLVGMGSEVDEVDTVLRNIVNHRPAGIAGATLRARADGKAVPAEIMRGGCHGGRG
jgi:hypothetical protein